MTDKTKIIKELNLKFDRQKKQIGQKNFRFNYQYLIVLVVIITAIALNNFYSFGMMLFTTFTLAYLSKGSRRKHKP